MIKNYLTYIKEQNRHDLDPYGEDDWDDLPPVLEIAKRQGKPYDQVTSLVCSNNQLTSLEGIENLINLQVLSCSENQLTSLEGIENLVNLKELYCTNNQFSVDYKNYLRSYCKKRKINLYV